jgi:hypothetical protein
MEDFRVVQVMSAACRAAHSTALKDLSSAALLRSLDDLDVEACRASRHFYSGTMSLFIVLSIVGILATNEAVGDQVVDVMIPSFWTTILLINSLIYLVNPILLVIPYLGLLVLVFYIYRVLRPSTRYLQKRRQSLRDGKAKSTRPGGRNGELSRDMRRTKVWAAKVLVAITSPFTFRQFSQEDKWRKANQWAAMNRPFHLQGWRGGVDGDADGDSDSARQRAAQHETGARKRRHRRSSVSAIEVQKLPPEIKSLRYQKSDDHVSLTVEEQTLIDAASSPHSFFSHRQESEANAFEADFRSRLVIHRSAGPSLMAQRPLNDVATEDIRDALNLTIADLLGRRTAGKLSSARSEKGRRGRLHSARSSASFGASVDFVVTARSALRADSLLSNFGEGLGFQLGSQSGFGTEVESAELILFHEDVVSVLKKLRMCFRPGGVAISDAQFQWLLKGAARLLRLPNDVDVIAGGEYHKPAEVNMTPSASRAAVTFAAFSFWFSYVCEILVDSSRGGELVPTERAWASDIHDVEVFHGIGALGHGHEHGHEHRHVYRLSRASTTFDERDYYPAGSSQSDMSVLDDGDCKDTESYSL